MAGCRENAGIWIVAIENDGSRIMHGENFIHLSPDPPVPSSIVDARMHLRRQVLERIAELLEDRCSLAERDEDRFQLTLEPARDCNKLGQMPDPHAVRGDQD